MILNKRSPVAEFEIPEILAKELSHALTQLTIRQDVARNIFRNGGTEDYNSYEEEVLMPIYKTIETYQQQITTEWVPVEYRDSTYSWNYSGWNVSGCKCQIYKNE